MILCNLLFWSTAGNAQAQVDWKKEWERTVQEAKKEGVIVVGIPARPELRKELEAVFKPKFGIDMDLSPARGPQNASKIAAEYNAGVKNFDVFIGGSGTYESLSNPVWSSHSTPHDLAGSQRGEKLVGWPYLGRQCQHQSFSLFLYRRRWRRRFLVQHPIVKAGRIFAASMIF